MFASLLSKPRSETAPTTAAPAAAASADSRRPTVSPAVDITETDTSVVVTADMPGVDASGVEISVERGVLTIRGRSRLTPPKDFRPLHQEWEPCDYERRFTIAESLDRDAIAASMRNGVLRLELPKAKEAQPRRIPVSAA